MAIPIDTSSNRGHVVFRLLVALCAAVKRAAEELEEWSPALVGVIPQGT